MTELPDPIKRQIYEHIQEGQRIQAIKAFRLATGASLRDSKKFVETWELEGELPPLPPSEKKMSGQEQPKESASPGQSSSQKGQRQTHPQVHSSGCGSSMIALLLLGGAIGWLVWG